MGLDRLVRCGVHGTKVCNQLVVGHNGVVVVDRGHAVAMHASIFLFFSTTIKFVRIDVILYGAEPMQLRCGASQLSGRCSNRRFAVKVQERESEVRGLVVLPGLPVSMGSPVRDERAPGLLSIPAPADEEVVCANNSN